jgi:hypothetical protein
MGLEQTPRLRSAKVRQIVSLYHKKLCRRVVSDRWMFPRGSLLCYVGGEQGGAIRRGWDHLYGRDDGRRLQPFVRGIHVCATVLDKCALLSRGDDENLPGSLTL